MSRRTDELVDDLHAAHEHLRDTLHRVPPELRERTPDEGWSIAGVVEHLALIEQTFVQLLGAMIERASAADTPPDDSPVLASIDVSRVLDRSTKVKARETSHPRHGWTAETALAELDKTRAGLIELLRASDRVDLAAVNHPHPLFGPMDGYYWIAFLAAHERRHTAQIREIAATFGAAVS